MPRAKSLQILELPSAGEEESTQPGRKSGEDQSEEKHEQPITRVPLQEVPRTERCRPQAHDEKGQQEKPNYSQSRVRAPGWGCPGGCI